MRKIPAPRVMPEAKPYWDAASAGQLLVKRCTDCGQAHHYPRDACPFCLSLATEWVQASGGGTLYTFSTMGQGEDAYTLAYVTLDEGPTMLTNLVGPGPYACDQRVRVQFLPSAGGHAVPVFAPCADDQGV